MLDQILEFIQTNLAYAPYLTFGLLLLAGFNLPVSEDLLLFTCAIMAIKNPNFVWPLFFGVLAGAYVSDLISYCLGRFLGPKLLNIKFFAKALNEDRRNRMSKFFENYGILTLIIGRFIPFGVRNPMFLTAGLTKMNAFKFAIGDLVASILTCSTYFYLYFSFGEAIVDTIKKFNIIIFCCFLVGVIIFLWRNQKRKSAAVS